MRIALACVLGLTRIAHATPGEADKLIDEATTLARDGKFVDAAAKFRAAFAADPRPELVCNVGIAYFKAEHELTRAQLYLSQCLTRGQTLDGDFVKQVREVLVAVEDQLKTGDFTPIDVVVKPEGASVWVEGFAPDERFVGSRLVFLPYGTHKLVVRADGHVEQTRPVEATSRQQRTVQITLEPLPVENRSPPPPPPPERPAQPSKLKHYALPLTASLVAAGAGGFALISYTVARDHADKANAARTTAEYDDESDQARSARTRAIVLAAGGGIVAAAATYLWVRALRTRARVELKASAAGAAAAVAIPF